MTRAELLDLFDALTGKGREIMTKKNADYTGGGSVFANFEASEVFKIHPVQGVLVRLTDKLQRINSFIVNGVLEVSDESVEDTLVDVINYSVLIAGLIRAEKAGQPTTAERQFPGMILADIDALCQECSPVCAPDQCVCGL